MKPFLVVAAVLLALVGLGGVAETTLPPAAAQATSHDVAASQTTTFAIKNMTCALCPVTVRKAMEGVAGVESVSIDFDAKTATVIFDPSVTSAGAIAAASTNAGYPASVAG